MGSRVTFQIRLRHFLITICDHFMIKILHSPIAMHPTYLSVFVRVLIPVESKSPFSRLEQLLGTTLLAANKTPIRHKLSKKYPRVNGRALETYLIPGGPFSRSISLTYRQQT